MERITHGGQKPAAVATPEHRALEQLWSERVETLFQPSFMGYFPSDINACQSMDTSCSQSVNTMETIPHGSLGSLSTRT